MRDSRMALRMPPERRLIVSIHDVGPRFEGEVDMLVDRLTRLLGQMRFAMLVVPNHWGEAPLAGNRPYQAKLRRWAEAGVEMFVHQGARQFEIWTGKPAPEEEMLRVVVHALRQKAETTATENGKK